MKTNYKLPHHWVENIPGLGFLHRLLTPCVLSWYQSQPSRLDVTVKPEQVNICFGFAAGIYIIFVLSFINDLVNIWNSAHPLDSLSSIVNSFFILIPFGAAFVVGILAQITIQDTEHPEILQAANQPNPALVPQGYIDMEKHIHKPLSNVTKSRRRQEWFGYFTSATFWSLVAAAIYMAWASPEQPIQQFAYKTEPLFKQLPENLRLSDPLGTLCLWLIILHVAGRVLSSIYMLLAYSVLCLTDRQNQHTSHSAKSHLNNLNK